MPCRSAGALNVAAALNAASRTSALDLVEVLRRVTLNDDRLALFGEAIFAAAQSAVAAKVRVLGRGLASGAIASDDARVDEERVWVRILLDVEAPHLRILEHLARPVDATAAAQLSEHLLTQQQPDLAQIAGCSYSMAGHVLRVLES